MSIAINYVPQVDKLVFVQSGTYDEASGKLTLDDLILGYIQTS